jgi:hypothetical protein
VGALRGLDMSFPKKNRPTGRFRVKAVCQMSGCSVPISAFGRSLPGQPIVPQFPQLIQVIQVAYVLQVVIFYFYVFDQSIEFLQCQKRRIIFNQSSCDPLPIFHLGHMEILSFLAPHYMVLH